MVYAVNPPGLVLNLHNNSTGSITVKGGTFVNCDPATGDDANPDDTFVAPGYKSVKISPDPAPYGTFEVVPDVVEINGVLWATGNVGAAGTFVAYGERGMQYQYGSKVGLPLDEVISSLSPVTLPSSDWDMVNNNPCPDGYVIPTKAQFNTLLEADKVDYAWVTTPVNGAEFTDKTSQEKIFLPAVQYRNSTAAVTGSTNGYYWCSDVVSGIDYRQYLYLYEASEPKMSNTQPSAELAQSVRCVAE